MRLRVYVAKLRMSVSERVREVRRVTDSPMHTRSDIEEYMRRFFELQLSWPKYLWAGHGACLFLGVKYLLDNVGKGPLHIQGVGVFILTFVSGFVLAVVGYAALTIAHDSVMDNLLSNTPSQSESIKALYKAWVDLVLSLCFLVLGIIRFVISYGSL
jgi:hypothetical protein